MEKRSRKIFKILKWLFAVYLILGVAFYFLQEKLLFHPEELDIDHEFKFEQPFKEIKLPVNNDKILSIVQFPTKDSVSKGVVLYFHGNRRNIERYEKYAKNFTRNGYDIWMIDYPGFGKSTGELSETIMYDDAAILYKMARAKYDKSKIIIYGKSLGTGIASWLAATHDCKRLILETPYFSIPHLFQHYAFMYPVAWMTKYNLPTYSHILSVNAPITYFHGTDDEVIPFKHATWLAKEKGELISIEGGRHNNLNDFPLYQRKLDSLLRE